jgi:hypothetical protein
MMSIRLRAAQMYMLSILSAVYDPKRREMHTQNAPRITQDLKTKTV